MTGSYWYPCCLFDNLLCTSTFSSCLSAGAWYSSGTTQHASSSMVPSRHCAWQRACLGACCESLDPSSWSVVRQWVSRSRSIVFPLKRLEQFSALLPGHPKSTASLNQFSHLCAHTCWCERLPACLAANPLRALRMSTARLDDSLRERHLDAFLWFLTVRNKACRGQTALASATSVILLILSDSKMLDMAIGCASNLLCTTAVWHVTMEVGHAARAVSFSCLLAHVIQQCSLHRTLWNLLLTVAPFSALSIALCSQWLTGWQIVSPVLHCLLGVCTALFRRLSSG